MLVTEGVRSSAWRRRAASRTLSRPDLWMRVVLDVDSACFHPDGRSDWRAVFGRDGLPYFAAFDGCGSTAKTCVRDRCESGSRSSARSSRRRSVEGATSTRCQ